MKKHLIIFFILFNSCSENLTETLDPIYKIPDNPISVLVIDDISQVNDNEKLLIQNFFDINLFEDEIIRAKKKLKINEIEINKIYPYNKSKLETCSSFLKKYFLKAKLYPAKTDTNKRFRIDETNILNNLRHPC